MIVDTVFKPNGIPFASKSKEKLLAPLYPIQFEKKVKTIFLIVPLTIGLL